ncbi:MAG: hypothetical protein AB1437_16465 [Pseudomonadota bacterium]
MIAKRWLKHTAAGLLDSFVSRNNDFIGYWAPGVLYTETRATGMRAELDLIRAAARPDTPAALAAAHYWSGYLREALRRHGSTIDDLETATVSLAFGLPLLPLPSYHMCGGDPFSCSVRLVSRGGDAVEREALRSCLPHLTHDGRRSTRYRA